ncbi:MAG: hypothetical protein OEZ68_09845 [Gammaproteobacteria bacterium]|nr:hypothetical protein [Gammaproteobacteria bacterium]MDH5801090.1 hypothetical protein [Gammaproteobacteria bacterium]
MRTRLIRWNLLVFALLALSACRLFPNFNSNNYADPHTSAAMNPQQEEGYVGDAIPFSNRVSDLNTNAVGERGSVTAKSRVQGGNLALPPGTLKGIVSCDQLLADLENTFYFESKPSGEKVDRIKVSAVGFGAQPRYYFPEAQRSLLTQRASKIDAYRVMAEMVGGLRIWGATSLSDMVVEQDRYRTVVDSYVRGARVVSIEPQTSGNYKTTLEMEVNQNFLNRVLPFLRPAHKHCMGQMGRADQALPSSFMGADFLSREFTARHLTEDDVDEDESAQTKSSDSKSSKDAPISSRNSFYFSR